MKMKNTSKWLLAAGVLSILAAPGAKAQQARLQNEGVQWQAPTAAVVKAAKADNKLILADFYADWCGYCKKQDATAYQDDRVILMTDQVVATRINEETDKDMIAQYQIEGYPTVVVFNTQGEELERTKGAFLETTGYVNWLGNTLFEKALPNLNAALEKQPDDIKLLTIMALVYNATKQKDKVAEFLNKAGDNALAKLNAGEKIKRGRNGQMARTFRLLSLYFQSQNDYERAAASLHYLSRLSSRPREVVGARIALAENLYQLDQAPKAIAELESLLELKGLTVQEKQAARTALKAYRKAPASTKSNDAAAD